MSDLTYDQFEYWCKYWGFTINEGYKAMCFVANIVGQNLNNAHEKQVKADNDPYKSNASKKLTKQWHIEAIDLSMLYGKLDSHIYSMLEKHESIIDSED
jgi:hypothetical protein